jgi:Lrp/AsnC family transcriptional regulator for asnA, asnC and gidA
MEKEYKVDEVDLKILKILEENSKTNYRKISEEIGIAIGTVSNRINNLTEKGIIKKFTIDLDTIKIGYDVSALILIQIEGKYISQVEEELTKNPNVYAIYDTTGDWDSIIAVKFKRVTDLNNFLKELNKIEHVHRTSTCVCLNVIKENIFFPIQLNEEKK